MLKKWGKGLWCIKRGSVGCDLSRTLVLQLCRRAHPIFFGVGGVNRHSLNWGRGINTLCDLQMTPIIQPHSQNTGTMAESGGATQTAYTQYNTTQNNAVSISVTVPQHFVRNMFLKETLVMKARLATSFYRLQPFTDRLLGRL